MSKPQTASLTPELIASLWGPDDPQISPDGQRVAWTAAPYGKEDEHPEQGIWVAPVDGSSPARRWTHGADDKAPRWSPDGTRLAFLSDRLDRGTHGLYVLETTGGEARPLVTRERSVESFAWSPDGRRLAFLAPDEPSEDDKRREKDRDDAEVYGERWQHQRLWLVDVVGANDGVNDGATDSADDADPERAWAPDLHLTELAWSPDGSRLALLGRRSPLLEHAETTAVYAFAVGEPDGSLVCRTPYASQVGWHGADTLVFWGPHDWEPQSSATAWAVSADGGEPRVVGTQSDEPRCTMGIAHAPTGTRTLLAVAEGLDTRFEWVDPATGSREFAQDLAGDLDAVTVVDGPHGPVVAAVQLSDGLVGRVVAGPPGRLEPLSDHLAGLEEIELGRAEAFSCRAADGIDLDAVVIRPPGGGAGPWPTVVLPHGGPYGRSGLWSHLHPIDWGQLLATHGYAAILPNYRGGLGHGNDFARAVRGDMGGAEWRDVMTIVDAVVDAGIADPDRLGVGGWSQGGFLTAWAVTATDRFKAAIMGAGVTDWGMLAATSDLPAFEASLGGDNRWDGPGPHVADAHSPISYASRRNTPLLILHGAEDKRVPLSQATAFHRALAGQPAPLEFVSYPREPHGIRERRHQVDLQKRVLEWFDRFLRSSSAGHGGHGRRVDS